MFKDTLNLYGCSVNVLLTFAAVALASLGAFA
jgi:hypothetical protein